jgi:hypothetical protein
MQLVEVDLVNDTPSHNTANYGCPYPHYSTCSGTPIKWQWIIYGLMDDACICFQNDQKK